jgi:hypothetical protein
MLRGAQDPARFGGALFFGSTQNCGVPLANDNPHHQILWVRLA